jgi:hypothetical protein
MARFSTVDILELGLGRNLEGEPAPAALKKLLAEDLHDAHVQREFWRDRAGGFMEEIKRLRGLLAEAGRPELAAGPEYYCTSPGCRNEAAPGAKLCKEDQEHRAPELCLVRDCEERRIHPLTVFCYHHKYPWREHGGDAFEYVEDIARGRFYVEPSAEEIPFRELPAESRPRSESGPPAPIPGLGDQISTHGLPPEIDPTAVGEALVRGVSDLETTPESPRPKCVYAPCGAPRKPGHALCEQHLAALPR